MTVAELFEKTARRTCRPLDNIHLQLLGHELITMNICDPRACLIQTKEEASEIYIIFRTGLQLIGMGLSNGVTDETMWRGLTGTLLILRDVLGDEFKIELPEIKVNSFLDDMIEDNLLAVIKDKDGEDCLRITKPSEFYDLRIRITSVPDGGAPGDVRSEWVGVTVPARLKNRPTLTNNVATDEPVLRGPQYIVPAQVAVQELKRKSPVAASWFEDNCPDILEFSFQIAEAEVITS